jgi:hypothetical protein
MFPPGLAEAFVWGVKALLVVVCVLLVAVVVLGVWVWRLKHGV